MWDLERIADFVEGLVYVGDDIEICQVCWAGKDQPHEVECPVPTAISSLRYHAKRASHEPEG